MHVIHTVAVNGLASANKLSLAYSEFQHGA